MAKFDPKTYAGPVIATDFGFYGGKRRDPGEGFSVMAGQFSERWMREGKGEATRVAETRPPASRSAEDQGHYDRGLALGKSGSSSVTEEDAKIKPFMDGYEVGLSEAAGRSGEGGGKPPVDIPPDWNKQHHKTRMALAKLITGLDYEKVADADEVIKAEVEKRDAAAKLLNPGD